MPAYNAEATIEETLNSVLAQTYTNIEVLVVDDGSQDRTAQIVESFAERDSRVLLIKQENAGLPATRDRAIKEATGDYVAPIDADDIWHPQKLQKQVQCLLSAGPSVGLVYAWVVRIDEDDLILEAIDIQTKEDFGSVEGNVLPALIYDNFVGCASVPLIRRTCFKRVGGYSAPLKARNAQGCEDWDIQLRIAEQYEFRVVREFLVGYRQARTSMSRNVSAMARSYNLVMASFRPKHPEIPDYVYRLSRSNFALYLSQTSERGGAYATALGLALKAIRRDPVQLFLQAGYLLTTFFKLVLSSVGRWIGLNPLNWARGIKRRLNRSRKEVPANHVAQLFDHRGPIHNARLDPVKRYGRIRWRRWLRILEMCQR